MNCFSSFILNPSSLLPNPILQWDMYIPESDECRATVAGRNECANECWRRREPPVQDILRPHARSDRDPSTAAIEQSRIVWGPSNHPPSPGGPPVSRHGLPTRASPLLARRSGDEARRMPSPDRRCPVLRCLPASHLGKEIVPS